jgi:aspartate-semialdehyde dehydrogenase
MKVAVIGATGLVGSKMLQVLHERSFPVSKLIPVASEKSIGQSISFGGKHWNIVSAEQAVELKPDIALFSAGSGPSKEFAPKFAAAGTFVIDNSSQWRMDENVPLVVPEINPDVITSETKIIANPNCSTIQMVVVLNAVHKLFPLTRIVVSTYQSVSGTGAKGIKQLDEEIAGNASNAAYPHQIFNNVLPQVDVFTDNGFTKEEMKMVNETRKILRLPNASVNATCVRVPVRVSHSESVYVECATPVDIKRLRDMLMETRGVVVHDDATKALYPMPINAKESDAVFVGRLRRDLDNPNAFSCWIVSDNLRKGAATNAVQIAEVLLERGLVTA